MMSDKEWAQKCVRMGFRVLAAFVGAGIGLAMCRNILQMCDGTISYSRSFNLGGACFTVTLPQR